MSETEVHGFLSTLAILHPQQSHLEKTVREEKRQRVEEPQIDVLFLSVGIIIDLLTYE